MGQTHPTLNVAVRAARKAGQIINNAARDGYATQVSVKGVNDFVTEVDSACEDAIIDVLLSAFPDHGIIAEESGRKHGNPEAECQWIIDPLDGTTNFIHGLPIYCVSIAMRKGKVLQHAVVYDPSRDELFTASRGGGAFLNNRRLRVSKRDSLADSLIGTGFPFRSESDLDGYLSLFAEVSKRCVGLRRPGAAALDMAYVAAGRYDAFFERGINAWDVAAGALLVLESGGLVADFDGESDYLENREIIAGNPKVFVQLLRLIKPLVKPSK